MAIAKIQNVTVDSATKKKIRDNSPIALPLNPTAQGWSAQHVRDQLYKAICGSIDDSDLSPNETNLLNVFSRRVSIIKEVLEELDNRYNDLTSTVLGTRSAVVSNITEEKVLFLIKPSFTDDVFVTSNLYLVFKDITNLYVLGVRTAVISLTSPYSTVLVSATKAELNLEITKITDGTIIAKKAEQDKEGNVISTHYVSNATLGYGISNHRIVLTLKDGNGNSIVSAIYTELPLSTQSVDGLMAKEDKVKLNALPTKGQYDSDMALKVPTNRSFAGLDLSVNRTVNELKTVIGEATAVLSGLMSATDKARLNALHALLGVESDADNAVNTINEVLAIFNQYPEGADLVNALAGKVDKVAGKELSKNDFTDILKAKLDSLLSGEHYYDKQYIDALKDLNGWSSSLITQSALTNGQTVTKATLSDFDVIKLFAINTSTHEIDTDSFDTSIGLVDGYIYKLFDNDDITFTIGATNCTFTDTVGGYELKIIGQKYVAQDAENVNYDNTVKNLLVATNVQDAIDEITDEVLTPTYENVLQPDLISEITATNNVEIIDNAGELIKVEGNEPTNLIVNGDMSLGNANWLYLRSTGNVSAGILTVIGNVDNVNFLTYQTLTTIVGHKYFSYVDFQTTSSSVESIRGVFVSQTGLNVNTPTPSQWYQVSAIATATSTSTTFNIYLTQETNANAKVLKIRKAVNIDITDMINKGIKNDSGVLFSALSDEEIAEQLAIWLTNGYPTKINKIISKSDNLFDSEFYDLTDLESENLVVNSDLLIDSNSDGVPDNFIYGVNTTDKTLVNGIVKFTATLQYGRFDHVLSGFNNQTVYSFARFKADGDVRLTHAQALNAYHSGSGQFEFVSLVENINSDTRYLQVSDFRSSDFTPIEVDYIGAINITDLVSRGILPSGLTVAQYKAILDSACNRSKTPMVNVPLRETSLISVEPSTAYKFIKASDNAPIHKVVEYATDGQVVKVTTLSYTDHKATFTTQPQTTKIKLVSDLMNRPTNQVLNPYFTSLDNWNPYHGTESVASNIYTVTGNTTDVYVSSFQDVSTPIGNIYYISGEIMTPDSDIAYLSISFDNTGSSGKQLLPSANVWYKKSFIQTTTGTTGRIQGLLYMATGVSSNGKILKMRNFMRYDITSFKNAGVVNDTGTLFSRLTNDEIKEQMDIWVQNGFPDHVIHALYPNGVDSAIAIKYDDADDIFRPQQIDELPLGITLRSGEYWQDGYIVKQNGNAEYYPLSTTFSAWNYGQLEAVYDSGIPADFTIKFAQNTKAQVQTNSEYLVEARERLDTLRINQELLIEKLGVDVEDDDHDSYVGITSAEYEYFGLEGIKEGDKLNIDAYGQGVLNLLPNTITATQTAFGLTITYDDTTGIVTVNGTSTAPNNFILKTGMVLGKPQGTTVQLMRYFVDGTANLNGSYIGYLLAGTSVSNRINENSESLYDPYINASGELKASGALSGVAGTSGQSLIFQVFASGMVFTDFKFKLGVFEGLTLQPFVMPSVSNSTAVDVYNHTANKLNTAYTTTPSAVSGITVTYDPLSQEYIFDGTASGANSITLSTNLFSVKSGDRLSIKRLYQSGDITPVSALPTISLISGATTIVSNSIYKMTAPEGQTPTPDVTFNTGTASADLTNVTLKLSFASGDVFTSYRCRIMIHDKSSDIGYVGYSSTKIGEITLEAGARGKLSFTAIDFGILSFVPQQNKLNVVFGTSLTDLTKTNLEYNAGIQSPNRRISELNERLSNIDNVFRDKVIAIWGDSRESNNPTSDPNGVGDQLDTSYPAILAKKLGATVLNFGLSGGCWAENTTQQDASSAIVNRVNSQDVGASADVIIISSMNDFKLATPLGSPLPANKDATTFYGAMRLTYDRLATKYPAKKIWLVLPQKRYDETTNYGGGSYLAYRKAQIEVAREYGIPTIDLYNNFPNADGTAFETTNMLNPTHFSAIGNDMVAELIARALLGNGNSGSVDVIPTIPTAEGTYTLKVVISASGIPTFSWVLDS